MGKIMYKVLITGHTGQVGSYLLSYLGKLGYECDTISHEEFDRESFDKITGFDVVVHCAWIRNRDLHSTEHLEFVEPVCHFFDVCKDNGVRVINLGSSSEYGVKFEPMKEDMICEPINTYGIAKLAVTLYAKKLGFNTLRLFTVTGNGGHSFFENKDKYDKWECPTTTRTPVKIEIVAKLIERLIHAEHLYGEIINVGGDESFRYGFNVWGDGINDEKWLRAPQNQYEPSQWACNTEKLKKLLNI